MRFARGGSSPLTRILINNDGVRVSNGRRARRLSASSAAKETSSRSTENAGDGERGDSENDSRRAADRRGRLTGVAILAGSLLLGTKERSAFAPAV